ncbi:MAG: phosphate ABC transporter substrate-binding protein [Clostridium butyricum]|nr:phosphate ABC transporter substrate-binding protein [Clostridium butyricum]
MKKKSLKLIVSTFLLTIMAIGIIGCGGNSNTDNYTDKGDGGLSGTLTVSGSSALLPLMEESIEKFSEKYPKVEISAQAGGSGTGLAQVLEGNVDIGNSDVIAEEKLPDDKVKELVDHKVIAQGFGIVVSKTLGIKDLTKQQIKDIYSGKITNWREIDGPDKEIFIVHRKSGSGTRATFENTILDGDISLENESLGVMQDSNGAVLTAMKENEGAISYVSLAYMNNQEAKDVLSVVSIDGVSPDKDNICDGSYPFWSYGHMYTKGEATSPAKEFIEFISSNENSESLENLGFISGEEIKVK